MLPDLKTPALWALGAALLAALAGLVAQRIEIAELGKKLSDEVAQHAKTEAARAQLATADAVRVAGAQQTHATDQQGIVDELATAKRALAGAGAEHRALSGRLRDTAAQLTAARDRLEAASRPPACADSGDQHRAVVGLLEEAGRLSAESGDLAAEGRGLLVQREAEVRALKALVLADRALMQRAAGPP